MSTKNREKKKKKKKKKDDFDFPRKTVGWHVLNSFRLGFIPRNPVVLVSLCKEGVKARGDSFIRERHHHGRRWKSAKIERGLSRVFAE